MSSSFLKIGNRIPDFQEIEKQKRRNEGFTILDLRFTKILDLPGYASRLCRAYFRLRTYVLRRDKSPWQAIDEEVGRSRLLNPRLASRRSLRNFEPVGRYNRSDGVEPHRFSGACGL